MDFLLPPLGEGIDGATVVGVLVKPGDAVTAGQSVLAVETDKAAVEVPAETAGTVESVAVKSGDKIAVGAVVLRFAGTGAAPKVAPAVTPAEPAAGAPVPPPPPAAVAAPAVTPARGGEFVLPALGEGIDAATVVGVLVKVGDVVTAGQSLVAVETDKAAVEVPAEVAGTVAAVHVQPGDKLAVGARLVTFAGGAALPTAAPARAAAPLPTRPVAAPPTADGLTTAAGPAVAAPAGPAVVPSNGSGGTKVVIAAGPATRRLARELGTPLADVRPTGRGSRVTLDDVKTHVRTRLEQASAAPAARPAAADSFAHPPLPDFAKYGPVDVRDVSNIRKKIAENLTLANRLIPSRDAERPRGHHRLGKPGASGSWTVCRRARRR